ncbi:hypothetical protein ACLOJK_007296 [Asimina triloba]
MKCAHTSKTNDEGYSSSSSECQKAELGGLEDVEDLDEEDYNDDLRRAMEVSRVKQCDAKEMRKMERDGPKERRGSIQLYGEMSGSQKKIIQMYKKGKDSVKNVDK